MISPHSFTESLRAFLSEALQGIFVHTPVTNGELVLPYVLLTCTAEAERIPGNHTWECNLAVELHTSGEDVSDLSSREMLSAIAARRKPGKPGSNSMIPPLISSSIPSACAPSRSPRLSTIILSNPPPSGWYSNFDTPTLIWQLS